MKSKKIYIAGHKGMVGSAVWRALEARGYKNVLGCSKQDLDLRNQHQVNHFFQKEQPEIVIDAAALVGGIMANKDNPYPFIMDNLQIQMNLMDAAHQNKVEKFIFLGSSCIYPKEAPQPLKEEYLLTAPLEPTNEWYAIAKIAGVKTIEAIRKQYNKDFVSLMPTNLYGIRDNFDLQTSHVLPAMIRKFHEAKEKSEKTGINEPVELWGTGNPKREFLFVDDLAEAIIFVMENKLEESLYNVGSGEDLSLKELALRVQKIIGHEGEIIWDTSKPDGTPRKVMEVSKLKNLGWSPKISLEQGIEETYQWFLENREGIREMKL